MYSYFIRNSWLEVYYLLFTHYYDCCCCCATHADSRHAEARHSNVPLINQRFMNDKSKMRSQFQFSINMERMRRLVAVFSGNAMVQQNTIFMYARTLPGRLHRLVCYSSIYIIYICIKYTDTDRECLHLFVYMRICGNRRRMPY